MISIYVGANSYIVDAFPKYAASAMAAKTLMSRLCGGAIPMFVDRFYASKAGPVWASFVLAMISLVSRLFPLALSLATCIGYFLLTLPPLLPSANQLMLPIPFAFHRYGAKIRAMSKRSSE